MGKIALKLVLLFIFIIAAGLIVFKFVFTTSLRDIILEQVSDKIRIQINDKKPEEFFNKSGNANPVVAANNEFTFDAYQKLISTQKENIFYSPFSISAALAMVYEGSKGDTADQIKNVFHFPETDILEKNFSEIYKSINSGSKEFELKTANALWTQKDYRFLPEYIKVIEQNYFGKATDLDFGGDPELSRKTINNYISEYTNYRINELLENGTVGTTTKLILTNAIFFKGLWEYSFNKEDTSEKDFYVTPTNIVKVPMMKLFPVDKNLNYAETEDAQVVELAFKGGRISMVLILPKKDLSTIENSFNAEKYEEYISALKETELDYVSIPRFEFDEKYDLKEVLTGLGMIDAFIPGKADLSGMNGNKIMYINFAVHQAFVKVDEEGTEAAAATAVGVMNLASLPAKIRPSFLANHPFIFTIRDVQTGNILFIGRVLNPTAK